MKFDCRIKLHSPILVLAFPTVEVLEEEIIMKLVEHYNDSHQCGGGRFGRGRGSGHVIISQLYGKSGHVTLKCFKRFDVHFTRISSSTPQAFLTDVTSIDYSQFEQPYEQPYDATCDHSWYVDSRATNHITRDL